MANTKKKKVNVVGFIFLALQVIASVAFVVLLTTINVLPDRYVIVIGAVLLVLAVVALIMHLSKSGKIVGDVYSIIIAVILILGSVYLWKTNAALNEVTTAPEETSSVTSHVTILTKTDSSLEGLQDLEGQKLGIQEMLDQAKMKQTLTELQPHFTSEIQTVEYANYIAAVEGLYAGDVGAIVFNEAFRDMVKETYPNFDSETEALTEFTYKEIIKTPETPKEESSTTKIDKEESNPSFIVYLSGNDSYGEITIDSGRSDVNILLVANPETRKILLLTTPRDSYVWLPRFDAYDKLTHSGVYGIDETIMTIEDWLNVDINYYARVNFKMLVKLVDAVGGIDVYNDIDFYSSVKGWHFNKGWHHMHGTYALWYLRERKAFKDEDEQRIRNQQKVMKALLEKCTSKKTLVANYTEILEAVGVDMQTSMSQKEMAELARMQLDDMPEWTIKRQCIDGDDAELGTWSMGMNRPLFVSVPKEESVKKVSNNIKKVMNPEED